MDWTIIWLLGVSGFVGGLASGGSYPKAFAFYGAIATLVLLAYHLGA